MIVRTQAGVGQRRLGEGSRLQYCLTHTHMMKVPSISDDIFLPTLIL
jgi:hypothetical protein